MEKITHLPQTQTYSFPRTNAKRQTAEVEFLPFAGKTNVMLKSLYTFTLRVLYRFCVPSGNLNGVCLLRMF